ncbi:uncharacterized protein zgc:113691 [Erpetoichthys calabaricus]|uniref:uncharacterized protein zgc:113691 n=1 Tax=Erpetoichthys calabaricus TaxID=27687 RepID=UPI0010A07E4C|nr:uncharacterized protein zgc:113691 [Erpetoichthys calabaricus]
MPSTKSNQKKSNQNNPDVLKLLEKYKKERDEAFQKEESLRDKMKLSEIITRTHAESLKHKVRDLTVENKDLRRTVKRLRIEMGLEYDPKFKGKTTKDIIGMLREKEQQSSHLSEENGSLNHQINQLTTALNSSVLARRTLEEQLSSVQYEMKELTKKYGRLLKLWEDTKVQRHERVLMTNFPGITPKSSPKEVCDKSVQTVTSISQYQRFPRTSSWELVQFQGESEKLKKKFQDTLGKTGAPKPHTKSENNLYSTSSTVKITYRSLHN